METRYTILPASLHNRMPLTFFPVTKKKTHELSRYATLARKIALRATIEYNIKLEFVNFHVLRKSLLCSAFRANKKIYNHMRKRNIFVPFNFKDLQQFLRFQCKKSITYFYRVSVYLNSYG